MNVEHIRRRLDAHTPARVQAAGAARAGVALVLQPSTDDIDLLMIRRATREGDPWSGHMALPGGRQHERDRDIIETAARETAEEVGVDLPAHGELLGALDELQAVARVRPLPLVISPLVWVLRRPVALVPNHVEVAEAVWVPLSFLRSDAARGTYERTLDGVGGSYPAFQYQDYTIWGLTHRILEGFLELMEA
jgi:8-oxo-dGTP pyrophosphatase MutT (NUDIX family)